MIIQPPSPLYPPRSTSNGLIRYRILMAVLYLVIGPLGWHRAESQQTVPVVSRAHAHNDYLHDRPLQDALEHGFNSVEADIFLVNGQLLVAHSQLEIKPDRSLESLYLHPLRQRVADNKGRVHADAPQFILLIDIKSDAEATYHVLHDLLSKYSDMLTQVKQGKVTVGAVSVIISGNRPEALIAAQELRYCGIDGRLTDLDSTQPAHLRPMISDNWGNNFAWRGQGDMPVLQREKLHDIVRRAHAQGRVVRFWATPDTPTSAKAVWRELVAAEVDLINTDRLRELAEFLRKQ